MYGRSASRAPFNEAGARAPRMRSCLPPVVVADEPFNEAGARAPRMPCTRASSTSRMRRAFNEAGARAPRMPSKERLRDAYRSRNLQ